MPELPEVECVLRGLAKSLKGQSIVDVKVLRKQSIGYPSPTKFAKLVKDHSFVGFNRRGKYLLLDLDQGAGLACHLRMSGALVVKKKNEKPDPHLRVLFKLSSGKELHFEDMRVFGRLWYVPKGMTFTDIIPTLSTLGPEPLLGLTGKHLREKLLNKRQAIKTALLDQTVLAGLGNIYADEVLFLSGIHPLRQACAISIDESQILVKQIKIVLNQAIELGGSTISDYKNSEGVNGNYQNEAFVYGRTGQPCITCQQAIGRVKLAGRSAHFCAQCQR